MPETTHYEVQVKQNGRWEIHARFSANQKADAIEEAKGVGTYRGIEAVKVIRETYNDDDGTSMENTVYAPGQRKHRPRETSPAGNQSREKDLIADDWPSQPKKTSVAPLSFNALIIRFLLITLFSTIVGGFFAWFAFLNTSGLRFSENARTNISIITFLAMFVISAIPMAMIFLNTKKK